jgi:DNA repair exonuclease SbcCD ATPase subunit
MNKLTPLETFKIDVITQETISKLHFLDTLLKSNMGSEMSEMMSEEISRVMSEQRNLEKKYARLGQQRSQLKGLKNKEKLVEVIEEIKETARELKESTRALCRVLKDNPDINGNQAKIRDDRSDLTKILDDLLVQMKNLSYGKFKEEVIQGLENIQKLGKLRKEEKELQTKIKTVTTDHKDKNAESWAEFEETEKEIKLLEKNLNDSKTDSDLLLKYLQDKADGEEICQMRLYEQEETALEDEIKDLNDKNEREKLVSEKIKDFLKEKKEAYDLEYEKWENKTNKEKEILTQNTQNLEQKKKEDEERNTEIEALSENQKFELGAKLKEEVEKQRELERKKDENVARDNAARYLQHKWIWWKTVGKTLTKKGRKKGGKKKKK